ncbi:putative transcription factor GRAS family [Helianthus debilis subsp. tardiflorus]
MLGSSSHSSHQDQNTEDNLQQLDPPPPPPPPPPLFHRHHQMQNQHQHQDPEIETTQTPPSIHMRQLLFTAAQLIARSDLTAAHRLISILSTNSSAYGDAAHRLVHSFTRALSLRLHLHRHPPPLPIILNLHPPPPPQPQPTNNNNIFMTEYGDPILQSYLSLNQITPYIRFCQLTANQAILEAIDQSHHQFQHDHHQQSIHILDFNIMHGVQWPPLMQAMADRYPPPSLRITATGTNLTILRRTGDRLSIFAHSLGLRFRFYPLLIPNPNTETLTVDQIIDHLSSLTINPNETLAVNCVLYLHRLLKNRDKLCLLLRKIKSLNPRIVTLAEQEANHNHPIFLQRFSEGLVYYTSIFESLEATLPPNSRERIEVEQVWFGREIADIVAEEGDRRKERHERFRSWEVMMRSSGFRNVPLSAYALSQAKLLLRLHYPSEGYNLEVVNDSFFLGWQNQPLFSVSSWH